MATFGKATFDTAIYASFRPTYPRSLFDFVFRYHERSKDARWDRAVDLGCGTGQATTELTPFKKVIGVDPSKNMVESARNILASQPISTGQYEFVQSAAEKLDFLEDASVDLLIAAQAGHWFDWPKMWPEAARVLRKSGSFAFWVYSEFRLTKYPALTPLITNYTNGTDTLDSLGPYWQQPGRSILENHLIEVPDANEICPGQFSDFERVYFTGQHYPDLPSPRSVILKKKMTWNDMLSYLRTWSSLHTFQESHPEDSKNADGDIALRFWNSLKGGVAKDAAAEQKDTDEIDVEWPVAMVLVKKA